jgi:hypothetical protein
MKTTPSSSRTAAPTKASAGADADFANLWNPTAVEFAGGLEVTEMVDSIPGELLELFKASQSAGKP